MLYTIDYRSADGTYQNAKIEGRSVADIENVFEGSEIISIAAMPATQPRVVPSRQAQVQPHIDTIYIEQRFCFDCLCTHWVEVTPRNTEICHGTHYWPADTSAQYVKRLGHGFTVYTKTPAYLPQDLALAAEAKARG
jgi:hypothetical protein